jgi:ribonuclease BN (tRNA processing enzyme)
LWDHFGTKAKVDEVLIKTVCIFITHIHGDHQLGILKMMQERDILLSSVEEKTPMFVVLPLPMIEWVSTYHAKLVNKEFTILVNSNDLNPNEEFYYQGH